MLTPDMKRPGHSWEGDRVRFDAWCARLESTTCLRAPEGGKVTWVKLDDAIDEHPKIAALSDSAFALFVCGLAYCNRNLTDGFIPNMVGLGKLRYCGGNPAPPIRELEDGDLWEPVEGGWQVHDFGEYQPSREGVLAEREAARTRMQKVRSLRTSGDVRPNSKRTSPSPVPVPVPVPEEEPKPLAASPRGSVYSPDFEVFWKQYPIHEGKGAAFTAYKKARKLASQAELLTGVERYNAVLSANPDRKVKWAQGWLRECRWQDEPAARPNGSKHANILALADRLEAEGL